MLTRKIIILLIFFLTKTDFIFSQTNLIVYNVKNGLSQNSVTCIFEDKEGLMWIGTQDGLNKFDGYRFVHYKYDESDTTSISDQYITAINEDGEGNLLIGTRNGLNLFNRKTEKFQRIYPNPSGKNVVQYEFNPIQRMENGNLIMSGAGDLFEWNGKTKKIKQLTNYISGSLNFSVYKNTYVQISSAGDVVISDQIKQTIKRNPVLDEKNIPAAQFIDRKNTIWWMRQSSEKKFEISFFDLEKMKWNDKKIETDEIISKIIFNERNQPIILTYNGLFTIEKNALSPLELGGSLIKTPALCAMKDRRGLFWIGFMNNGIGLYNPNSEAYHLITNNIKNDACYAGLEILPTNIWMGTASGLYQTNPHAKTIKKLSDIPTGSLVRDNDNNIWAGSLRNGLFLLNPSGKTISHFTKENSSIVSNTVFHLNHHKKSNRIIISTPTGVSVYTPEKREWLTLNATNGMLAGSYVMHSFTDSKNKTWISSNMGVDVFDENFKHLLRFNSDSDTSSGIKRTIVTGATEDLQGAIWISTLSNGVYKYDKGKFIRYNIKNGLSSNVIYGVTCDNKNRIWIAGTNGINLIDQRDGSVIKITKENGLPTTDYSIGSLHKSGSGMLYVGSPDGVVRIDPEKVKIENTKYTPFIKRAEINFKTIPIEESYSIRTDDKQISFEFSAPCFINSDQLIFQYRLKGFEEKWITLSSTDNRKISFTNLPYTSLSLEIRCAMNLSDMESAPVLSIGISRKPPLWRDVRFVAPLVIILLILLALAVRYLTRRKIKQRLREATISESIYKERERISRDLHDSLGAYAAAIKNNIIQLEQDSSFKQQLLGQLKENAEDMVSALRENIWALQHEHINITSISDRFKNMINRLAPNYPDLTFDYKETIEHNIHLSPGESIHLIRIMQEALTNAIKHSECSKISVDIEAKENLIVTLSDNGTGFEFNKDQNKYGIRNMKDRASEAGFDLSIESSATGTAVKINKKI